MNKTVRIAVSAAAACAALITGVVHAEDQAVTFKVPYKFSNIPLSHYDTFLLICSVSKGTDPIGAGNAKLPLDANGGASGSVDIVVKATMQGKLLSDATDWNCYVDFHKKGADGMTTSYDNGYKVTKSGAMLVAGSVGKF